MAAIRGGISFLQQHFSINSIEVQNFYRIDLLKVSNRIRHRSHPHFLYCIYGHLVIISKEKALSDYLSHPSKFMKDTDLLSLQNLDYLSVLDEQNKNMLVYSTGH